MKNEIRLLIWYAELQSRFLFLLQLVEVLGRSKDMNKMLKAGADKVSVNSSAVANPQLIADCAEKVGNQCVVVAIDAKKVEDGSWACLCSRW